MNIVVVEDEGITALFLKEVIETYGHMVVGMFDEGNALFLFLETHDVDLVFMDIQIKGTLDGIQVANLTRLKYPDISFVFLTSFKDSFTIESARIVRPIGYLTKPVVESDIEAILMVVESTRQIPAVVNINSIKIGLYSYHVKEKTLHQGKIYIALSKKEHLCVRELFLHRDSHVSAEQLIGSIWVNELDRHSSLRELTSRLRKKLLDLDIRNIPNVGYIISEKKS